MPERGWTRRTFLKAAAASGAAAVLPRAMGSFWASAAPVAEDAFRIGLLVPEEGPLAEAGKAAALGAELGAAEATHLGELFGKRFELVMASAAEPEGARREARRLVEEDRAFAIAGGLDDASCFALSELADRQGRLFLNIGCASDAFRGARCRQHTFHVEASTGMYADALAQWLVREAGLRRWHFVTGASEVGDAAYRRARRSLLEEGGEELGNARVRPGTRNFADPLRELRRTRPDVVFLTLRGATRAAFLRQYGEHGLSFEVATLFPGDLPPWATPPETRLGIWPAVWHHELFRYGAEQLNRRFSDRSGRPLESRGWAAWTAVKILAQAVLRAGTTEATELVRFLKRRRTQFDGHKGRPLTFRPWDHQLRQPLYLVRPKREAEGVWDALDAVAELPRRASGAGETSQEFLDRLGDRQEETACRFPRA